MHKIFGHLMGSVYDRVVFAPSNDFGFAGGDGDDGEEEFFELPDSDEDGQGDGGDDDVGEAGDKKAESKDKKRITNDPAEFMRAMFGAGDDDEGGQDEDEDETPEQAAETEKAIATQLKDTLANLTLPEAIFPEDFDPSDPKQLHQVLASVQIHAATNAVKAMMTPVQATLTRMMSTLRREHRDGLRSNNDQQTEKVFLEETFPGLSDPTIAPMIRMTWKQAKAKHPNNRSAAVAAAKKALSILGADTERVNTSPKQRQAARGQGSDFRTGDAALDGFNLSLPRAQSNRLGRLR